MSAAQATLLIVGAACEFAGIALVASPDLVPQAVRLSNWLRGRYNVAALPVRRVVRRLLRRPPERHFIMIGAAGEINVAGRLSGIKSTSNVGSLEDKVGYLLRRDEEAQRDMSALRERLDAIESGTPERLRELRKEMEAHFAGELKAALAVYLPLRVVGALALFVGLVCVTAANFV